MIEVSESTPLWVRQATKVFGTVVAGIQLVGAVMWMLAAKAHSSGATYKPAVALFSFLPGPAVLWWAGLLAILSAAAIICLWSKRDTATRILFAALVGYWGFWAVLWAVAFFSQATAGVMAMFLALIAAVGNARPVLGLPVESD